MAEVNAEGFANACCSKRNIFSVSRCCDIDVVHSVDSLLLNGAKNEEIQRVQKQYGFKCENLNKTRKYSNLLIYI